MNVFSRKFKTVLFASDATAYTLFFFLFERRFIDKKKSTKIYTNFTHTLYGIYYLVKQFSLIIALYIY